MAKLAKDIAEIKQDISFIKRKLTISRAAQKRAGLMRVRVDRIHKAY